MIKNLKAIFIFFFILTSTAISESEVIKFGSGVYEGESKKGRAHGMGTFTFPDGTKYVGKFKKNKFHGEGVYTDKKGNTFEGKWKHGTIKKQINSRTREVIKLSTTAGDGQSKHFEVRGPGGLSNKWFEAELREATAEEIMSSTSVELDIFDLPLFTDPDYGDEKHLQKLLNNKIAEVNSENSISNNTDNNSSTITGTSMNLKYMLTDKGQRDQKRAETQQASGSTRTSSSDTPTLADNSWKSAESSGSGGGGGGSGGGGGGSGC